MVLIDSDVLIDYLRGSIFANKWLGTLDNDAFAIPGVVAMELVIVPKSERPGPNPKVLEIVHRCMALSI
ncbi:MAG: PIN domain-containing protein [Bryobacteraceae bacterium]